MLKIFISSVPSGQKREIQSRADLQDNGEEALRGMVPLGSGIHFFDAFTLKHMLKIIKQGVACLGREGVFEEDRC